MHKRWFAGGVLTVALVLGLPVVRARQNLPQVTYPSNDAGVQSLSVRAREQQANAAHFQMPHDFRFTDRVSESGITFVHRIVDDAGLYYKAVHYDHGNGLAIADVDGDGLYDIYFVNQAGPNELWKNLGGGKFKNITAEAGVGGAGRISVAASFADIDNDGDPDLYVTTVRGGNLLFENDGHGHFRDITRTANLQHVAHSSGSMFFDYNNDGLLDLLVCDVGAYTSNTKGAQGQYVGLADAFSGHMYRDRFEHPVLYQNMGQRKFRDVTAAVQLNPIGWCGDAAFADLNEDGWSDVYFLNMMGSNHYFENQQGKRFVEKTPQYFPKTPWGAMGVKFFDFDNDGRLDLLVTDMHSDMFGDLAPADEKKKALTHPAESFLMGPPERFIFGNALYHNLGGGKFEEVSDAQGVENYWPWGPSVGDLNADGWDDIFIASSMNFPFRYGVNSLLLNNNGRGFLDAEFLLGIEPRKDNRTHTPSFELDCAHIPADPRGLMHQICEGRTDRVTVLAPLGSRSSAIFDLDEDGDLDIVTNEFNSAPQILVSDLASRRTIHWLSLKLEGTSSNRDGLGATVRVVTPTRTYMKYNDGKSGYLSQSSLPLWFGLGEDTSVTRIEINWPSGRRQVVTQDLAINRVLHVKEP
jgi:hypothetical protein